MHELSSWDLFVLRHRKTGNLVIHAFSVVMFYVSPPLAYFLGEPWLLALFFLSGVTGAIGHYVFKDGGVSLRETTSSPQVIVFVPMMFWKIARGTYWTDVAQAEAKYLKHLKQPRAA